MTDETKTMMSEELAEAEVHRWAEANDIDLLTRTADGQLVLDASVPKLVKAVQRGNLVVNDNGEFEYTVSGKSPQGFAGERITLKAPTGAAYMAMDSYKEQQGVHKTMAIASAITGKDVSWFGRLHNVDYKVVVTVVGFFIAG